MTSKTDRRHMQGDDTRERILDAAAEIAAERGYEGTSMAAIAQRSGASMSSIYWHFADKDALLAAVIQRSFDAWAADRPMTDLDPRATEDRDALARRMATHAVAIARNPDFLRLGLMLSLERRPVEPAARAKFIEVRQLTLTQLRELFRRLLGQNDQQIDEQIVQRAADTAMACVDGLFIAAQIEPGRVDVEDTLALVLRALFDRIAPPQA